MVTSFIVKEGSETIRHRGCDRLIDELYSILHKTRINRSKRPQVMKFLEKLSLLKS